MARRCWRGLGSPAGKIHGEALAFKLERLNPVTNLGNIFSLRSVTRMAKSLLPAAVVVALGVKALKGLVLPMPVMSVARLPATLDACFSLAVEAAWVMVAWSALDYAVERMAWNKKLRMTKQEMRDEVKETMGNPQVKGRIRRIQNAMRRRKVKADISRASVVITNPTHYAVALEFSFEPMLAPTVLAKGRNLHALRIREEARWAGVPIVENPPLARSLYKSVEEGQAIPYELYCGGGWDPGVPLRQQVEKAARERKAAEEAAKVPRGPVHQLTKPPQRMTTGRIWIGAKNDAAGNNVEWRMDEGEAQRAAAADRRDQHGIRDADPGAELCPGHLAGGVDDRVGDCISQRDPGAPCGGLQRLSDAAAVAHALPAVAESRVEPQDSAARPRGHTRRGQHDRGVRSVRGGRELRRRVRAVSGADCDPVPGGEPRRGRARPRSPRGSRWTRCPASRWRSMRT